MVSQTGVMAILFLKGIPFVYKAKSFAKGNVFVSACNAKSSAIVFLFLLRLHVTQKVLQLLLFLFFISLLLTAVFAAFSACDQVRTYEYNIPYAFKSCPLEINSNGRVNRQHVESCPLTTKNITPLPQLLWPPNLVGW